ncbi:MAG TPA: hypothetical protein VKN16_13235 [Methylomirabilota bacterium]|jgi:hypothetical protein|nr:hypothetical protein [Methylomirabilota bacterium]
MIPDRVVEVLHGPTWIQIGSRDEALRPAHTVAVGAVVHDDRQTVTVFVPTARSGRVLRDLTGNGRIAVGLALASHESYQLKGTYISSRPTDDTDRARQEARRAALLESALEAGYPEAIARPLALGLAITPGVAITFRAEQVFLQTPGPGAGTLLS